MKQEQLSKRRPRPCLLLLRMSGQLGGWWIVAQARLQQLLMLLTMPQQWRQPEGAQRRPARPADAEAESASDGESEEGPRAPREVVLAARQQAAYLTPPAQRAAQLHPEHASPLAAARLQAAAQCAAAPTGDKTAALAAIIFSAQAQGLSADQVAQIAAATVLAQQTLPAAAGSAVPTAKLPAKVLASDICQRPFPSLSSLASLKQVWDLMNNGINGKPSLISLEDASKNKWRKGSNAKETQNYYKQWETLKAFVAEVSARADRRAAETHSVRSPNKLIAQLDATREAEHKPVATYVNKIVKEYRQAKAAQKAAAAAAL